MSTTEKTAEQLAREFISSEIYPGDSTVRNSHLLTSLTALLEAFGERVRRETLAEASTMFDYEAAKAEKEAQRLQYEQRDWERARAGMATECADYCRALKEVPK